MKISGKSVLVVEDESITAMRIEDDLRSFGFDSVEVALDIQTARQKVESQTFDLFLLDVNLGEPYDGIEFAAELKKQNKHTQIIFITGNSDALTIEKAREIEPRAYLLKPFTSQEIRVNLELLFHSLEKSKQTKKEDFSKNLLDHHPNLVLRVNTNQRILFVNPVISRITGEDATKYIGLDLDSAGFNEGIQKVVSDALAGAEKKKRRFTQEVSIPTILGERMMFVVVIPEFNAKREIDAVILLMQDITDQKIATEFLVQRNKKIVDSINYSQKIQQALLPTTMRLQSYLNDSAILLMPKDVVSGDFPWLYKKNEFLYLAAVDCTGHGVPGALLSVIIHFLLNEVSKFQDGVEPGKMLELLHLYTKRTLKQNMPNADSNDGADIALCRVNLNTGELAYSGAHRSLFYCDGGTITELKGDRQPIGGEQYSRKKKRLTFTTQILQLSESGKVLMFSDGLTDQFGGPDKPVKKFSSARVAGILNQSCDKDAHETVRSIEEELNNWKGDYKQMDDVLAICFRYKRSERVY